MSIITYRTLKLGDEEIHRDTNVLRYNVYIGNGQGCGTVWYPNVKTARKALKKYKKIPDGYDSGYCKFCKCHYSSLFGKKEFNKYKNYVCKAWKEEIANDLIYDRSNLDRRIN